MNQPVLILTQTCLDLRALGVRQVAALNSVTKLFDRLADLGRLSRHKQAPAGWKTLRRTKSSVELGNLAVFLHFFGPKESGDEAVTNGDKLGRDGICLLFRAENGIESKVSVWSLFFDRNRANLKAEAPHLPSDTKKQTFRSWPFCALFDQQRSGDKAGDIGKNVAGWRIWLFCRVFRPKNKIIG